MTGAEMMQVLQNAEEVLEGLTTKLKVEYDNQDLEGLMQMGKVKFEPSASDNPGTGKKR